MKKIPNKNYYILILLLAVTAVLTLSLSNVYLNREKLVSSFYEYSNKITPEEFDAYMIENTDVIIYISDKYDLSHQKFENDFKEKLNHLNLKHNLIYINKSDINKKFIKKLKTIYGIDVNLKKLPTIIVVIDKKVIKNVSINSNSNVDTLIEYGEFE